MEVMAQYASDEGEKSRLQAMASGDPSGAQEHDELFNQFKINVVELLERFSSVKLPLEVLVELVCSLQPRYYTISSSNLLNPQHIHLTVTLDETVLPDERVHTGVGSGYLCSLKPGKDIVRCFLRASSFYLPKSMSTPVIMIGPGTGVAPMRAFIQEARHYKSQGIATKGNSYLTNASDD
jgi:sulfite reductase alpha subunit-like flavoprotein